jgi:lysophospholipase L1-like esterase
MTRIRQTHRRRARFVGRGWLALASGLILLIAILSVAAHRLKLVDPALRPASTLAPAVSVMKEDDAPGIRIMPLGDSLTDGENIPGGYRIDLWSRLAAGGPSINFVGSQSNGPTSLLDRDHEGHRGWRIDEIGASVEPWLQHYQPQIVLLLIGTNDVVQNADLDGAPGRLGALIDQITTVLPTSHVVVASIPPLRDQVWQQRVLAYNAAIPTIVGTRGPHVSFVDLFNVVDAGDLIADGIHLTPGGNRKLADAWYFAIRRLLDAQ